MHTLSRSNYCYLMLALSQQIMLSGNFKMFFYELVFLFALMCLALLITLSI